MGKIYVPVNQRSQLPLPYRQLFVYLYPYPGITIIVRPSAWRHACVLFSVSVADQQYNQKSVRQIFTALSLLEVDIFPSEQMLFLEKVQSQRESPRILFCGAC